LSGKESYTLTQKSDWLRKEPAVGPLAKVKFARSNIGGETSRHLAPPSVVMSNRLALSTVAQPTFGVKKCTESTSCDGGLGVVAVVVAPAAVEDGAVAGAEVELVHAARNSANTTIDIVANLRARVIDT
jgi:hypothetical protein